MVQAEKVLNILLIVSMITTNAQCLMQKVFKVHWIFFSFFFKFLNDKPRPISDGFLNYIVNFKSLALDYPISTLDSHLETARL